MLRQLAGLTVVAMISACVLDWTPIGANKPTERCEGVTCEVNCATESCNVDCGSAVTCVVGCGAGDCDVDCGNAQSCTVSCAGGGCVQTCTKSWSCEMQCPTGDCTQQCASVSNGTSFCHCYGCDGVIGAGGSISEG